jgi:hypothetical protein
MFQGQWAAVCDLQAVMYPCLPLAVAAAAAPFFLQDSSSSIAEDEPLDPAAAAAAPVPADVIAARLGASGSSAGLSRVAVNGTAQDAAGCGPAAAAGAAMPAAAAAGAGSQVRSYRERCKYIPLRLKLEERRLLRWGNMTSCAITVWHHTCDMMV